MAIIRNIVTISVTTSSIQFWKYTCPIVRAVITDGERYVIIIWYNYLLCGDRGSTVVKVLCYK